MPILNYCSFKITIKKTTNIKWKAIANKCKIEKKRQINESRDPG